MFRVTPTVHRHVRRGCRDRRSGSADDPTVRLRDAIEMLAESGVDTLGPTAWADLGCGTGTFNPRACRPTLTGQHHPRDDRDGLVLRRMPPARKGVSITTHRGDFTNHTWPFANLDGILRANSLHYVDQSDGIHPRLRTSDDGAAPLPHRRIRYARIESMGASSGLTEEVHVAVHRRRLLVDHDAAVAAIRVSACCALCRFAYEFSSMTPLECGCGPEKSRDSLRPR